jgi:hypothetical protein
VEKLLDLEMVLQLLLCCTEEISRDLANEEAEKTMATKTVI